MQLTFKKRQHPVSCLAELGRGEQAVLELMDLPEEMRSRLMELGFFPGTIVGFAGSAPGGDPRIFRVDGCDVALRVETACQLRVRPLTPAEQEAS